MAKFLKKFKINQFWPIFRKTKIFLKNEPVTFINSSEINFSENCVTDGPKDRGEFIWPPAIVGVQ